jgi:hypothetical protein
MNNYSARTALRIFFSAALVGVRAISADGQLTRASHNLTQPTLTGGGTLHVEEHQQFAEKVANLMRGEL